MGSSECGRERQALMEMRRLCFTTIPSLAHGNCLEAGVEVEAVGGLIVALGARSPKL